MLLTITSFTNISNIILISMYFLHCAYNDKVTCILICLSPSSSGQILYKMIYTKYPLPIFSILHLTLIKICSMCHIFKYLQSLLIYNFFNFRYFVYFQWPPVDH